MPEHTPTGQLQTITGYLTKMGVKARSQPDEEAGQQKVSRGNMLDREGFRSNVGIILLNLHNKVWWGKRVREHSWQFPQGGIKFGETPEQAMYRELAEETGLRSEHVEIVGRTKDWLRYEVPDHFIRREIRGHYRGQKQIWFLLQLVGRDSDVNLRHSSNPEFDAWRWHDYWAPLEVVIEFKRGVYQLALEELSRYLPTQNQRGVYRKNQRSSQNNPNHLSTTKTQK